MDSDTSRKGGMKPATQEECLAAQARVSAGVDDALKEILTRNAESSTTPLYGMLQYFMGFLDEKFQPEKPGVGGKRFRPALCLFIADSYGVREAALDAALAIELFHNFSLIHDDIADHDEERRNRPTVWKQWGVNHAINAGDMQLLFACELCVAAGPGLGQTLLAAFEEVIEGQYLDFELAEQSLDSDMANKKTALVVNEKKTGALLAASAECAGIVARQSIEEREQLRSYGMALGQLFQLVDDYRSVWETQAETGKDTHSDIREHKRTVPFFEAHEELQGEKKEKLGALYSLKRQLTEEEVGEALALIDSTGAKQKVLADIQKYADSARAAAKKLSVSDDAKSILLGIVEMLVPKSRE